jgi:hypothetical protein
VEKALTFRVDRMDFLKVGEVPEGHRIGFAILVSGDPELMLQSTESVRLSMRPGTRPALVPQNDGGNGNANGDGSAKRWRGIWGQYCRLPQKCREAG